MNEESFIQLQNFIQATRDSGYKDLASSIAELIDNSLEASATNIVINIAFDSDARVIVSDDGRGMSSQELVLALQFGGSTRFNCRQAAGRFGMGLPNSSLSRARRVDVYSWRSKSFIWHTYLDVDEIAAGSLHSVPKPRRVRKTLVPQTPSTNSGTVVVWSKCDRLGNETKKRLVRLRNNLGQIFREALWQGKSISINGQPIKAVDPLFLRQGNNLVGALVFGQPLHYSLRLPSNNGSGKTSAVTVTFTELPIEKWHGYSNDEKRDYRISKQAGVSIVRAGREIDYGWFFMGSKRKENYDDWWRCQVNFEPELDELFGVAHTKQEIRPSPILKTILSPDIERIAHLLNGKVRRRFSAVKANHFTSFSERLAKNRDHLLEPLKTSADLTARARKYNVAPPPRPLSVGQKLKGFSYRMDHKILNEPSFFVPIPSSRELVVLLNEEHPFYQRVFSTVAESPRETHLIYGYIELLLFAAARAECTIRTRQQLMWARKMRELWSKTLAVFLD